MINTIGKDKSLVDTILAGLKSTKSGNQNGRMYASTSAFCERQTALGMTYTGDIDIEPETEMYFSIGLAIEDSFLKSLRNQNVLLFSQFVTPDIGLNIGGKIDGIYKLPDGKIRLLEIKSCGSLPQNAYPENVAQATLYSAIVGLPIDLLYGSRLVKKNQKSNELAIKQIEVNTNHNNQYKAMYTAIFGKLCADNGLMPDIPDNLKSENDCGFCKFKNICWQGEPSHLEAMSQKETDEISLLTKEKCDAMMSEVEISKRRNGVLKHLSQHGSSYAKSLLSGTDWNDLV